MKEFQVKLQNASVSHPQKSWISMGLPKSVVAELKDKIGHVYTEDNRAFPAAIRGEELFVNASLKANETVSGKCILDQEGTAAFAFSDWVIDQPEKLIPRFAIKDVNGNLLADDPMVFWDGNGQKPEAYFKFEQNYDVRTRVFFHTVIKAAKIVVEGWMDIYNNQDAIPMIVRATYSNVADPDKLLNKQFGSFSMFTGEKVTVDFRRAKGLHDPVFRSDLNMWETELASPRAWWRARVIECFGAMLCLPPYDKLATELQKPGNLERFISLKAREEAPNLGIALVWNGKFLATGSVPKKPINERNLVAQAYNSLLNRVNTYGDEYNARAYAQPPNSGQTGSQPDFGVSRGELVITSEQPWALLDYRFSVQAWMLRPYAHKEQDWTPIKAANHQGTKLYNLAVDTRFGNDLLGFPNPIPYNEFWTGSDNQHRSDNLLFAMYELTKDPSIKATIEDLLEVSKMELKTWLIWGQPNSIESPRGWGRPLLSMAHAYALGFEDVKSDMLEMLDVMYKGASMFKIPQQPDRTVRTLSNNGFKYGWTGPNGQMIRAWVCWEESIAAIGLWAVYKATGDERAKTLALEIGKTITKHGFFKATNNNWYSCYCVRWDVDNPGKPLPDSAYNLNPVNNDVVVYGMHQWMLPSIRIMLEIDPDCAEAARGKEIINFFGAIPMDYNDSCWWAV